MVYLKRKYGFCENINSFNRSEMSLTFSGLKTCALKLEVFLSVSVGAKVRFWCRILVRFNVIGYACVKRVAEN